MFLVDRDLSFLLSSLHPLIILAGLLPLSCHVILLWEGAFT